MPRLRDGSYVEDRVLDRIPEFHPASLNFPVCAALSSEQQKTPKTTTWTIPAGSPILDQGQEGACVGFGITNELRFNPVPIPGLDATFARQRIYWPAQQGDPWPGGSYPGATPVYEGTSVHAGIQVGVDLGYYTEFRWAFSEPEMMLGVGYLGPAVIGINWYSGMYRPNAKGFLTVTGDKVGGHCILVKAVNVRSGYYTVYNSWGPTWGDKGCAKISRSDMAKLLDQDGECCLITGRGTGKPQP
jgi:hypothetical protein